ncbi:hypothetical protein Calle1_78 [Cellulophaga phage Calle_1]|uniref:Uncharacterized protein n=1 Tax=Cellulophaga phage Calle_1 TaxID=2745643 RepID=A0A8E4ZBJ0_9CAUD|nr:hypothetical protein M1M22_gp037 [Cellulophaga phage Calle_1]QQV89737.1 hypothetical protein Calle1_78 [Cellulophaga phage Calle_1]QQV89852.1 hypothetical protein Calle2_78 [Cellulophaga phage Calle_2]QQV89867.1 hypothetical protein Calle3_78 [Cellulophaga phage Calle_3]
MKNLEVINAAFNKATKAGVYDVNEVLTVASAINNVAGVIQTAEASKMMVKSPVTVPAPGEDKEAQAAREGIIKMETTID